MTNAIWRALKGALAAVAAVLLVTGCTTVQTGDENVAGRPTRYDDPGTAAAVGSVGIESQDIIGVSDQMVRDLLETRHIIDRADAPRIVLDAAYVTNESSSRVNRNIFTDRMRVALNRAAQGRVLFLAREHSDMVDDERDQKRRNQVDAGTTGSVRRRAGADFRLVGRITSLDSVGPRTGTVSRYTYISFEMVDLETSVIVWSNDYEFRKSGQPDIVNR